MLLNTPREATAVLQADLRALDNLLLVRLARRLGLVLFLVVLRLVLARGSLTFISSRILQSAAEPLVRLLVQLRDALAVGPEHRRMGRLQGGAESAGSRRRSSGRGPSGLGSRGREGGRGGWKG